MPVFLIAKSLRDIGSKFTAHLLLGLRSRLSDSQTVKETGTMSHSLTPSRSEIRRLHFFPDFGGLFKVCRDIGLLFLERSVTPKYFSHHLIPNATTADPDITTCHAILPTDSAPRRS